MNYGVIYVATNNVTGEQYVGQTRQKFKTRVASHLLSAKNPRFVFHRAISTYGKDAFSFQEVFFAFDKSALDFAEKEIIKDLAPVYNMTKGGSGMPGPVSNETRAKRSIWAKRRWGDPAWRAKTIAAIQKASDTQEFKDLCSANAKERNLGKLRWVNYTKKQRGKKNKAESISRSWADPVIREKRIAGMLRTFSNLEVRKRLSERAKGRVHSQLILDKIAKTKYKPVYCAELGCTFLSQKNAAIHLGVQKTTITEAIKRKGKVLKQYTLVRVM